MVNVDPRKILYQCLQNMKQRCNNPKDKNYRSYGAKGIKICDEWLNNFNAFYEWAISNGWQKGLAIDRIDPKKGYNKENCQWITKSENSAKRTRDTEKYFCKIPDPNTRSQIAFDFDAKLRQKVKIIAALRNMSMSSWIQRAIRKELILQASNPLIRCTCDEKYEDIEFSI